MVVNVNTLAMLVQMQCAKTPFAMVYDDPRACFHNGDNALETDAEYDMRQRVRPPRVHSQCQRTPVKKDELPQFSGQAQRHHHVFLFACVLMDRAQAILCTES